MFSFKNIYSSNINASNLMFVTGPTRCGKSWLLHHNMEAFLKSNAARPTIFHYDFSAHHGISFQTFLVTFERMIIDVLA